jgi:hypothetical protein
VAAQSHTRLIFEIALLPQCLPMFDDIAEGDRTRERLIAVPQR